MFGSVAVDPVYSHDVPSPGVGVGVLLHLLAPACKDIVEGKSSSTLQHGRQTFLHKPTHPTSLSCRFLHKYFFCLLVSGMSHQTLESHCPGVGAGPRVIQEPLSPRSVCCSSENENFCHLESGKRLFRPVNKDPFLLIPKYSSGSWNWVINIISGKC